MSGMPCLRSLASFHKPVESLALSELHTAYMDLHAT